MKSSSLHLLRPSTACNLELALAQGQLSQMSSLARAWIQSLCFCITVNFTCMKPFVSVWIPPLIRPQSKYKEGLEMVYL